MMPFPACLIDRAHTSHCLLPRPAVQHVLLVRFPLLPEPFNASHVTLESSLTAQVCPFRILSHMLCVGNEARRVLWELILELAQLLHAHCVILVCILTVRYIAFARGLI